MGKKILFTGGGSAGHVTPNIALIEHLLENGWEIAYAGSRAGIERSLTARLDIPYHEIATGKLRRYFDWQNFIDPLFIILGILQSIVLCLKWRPDIVFSKGGFVAVPLVAGAWLCRIPVISHESDITPGLANRLCFPFSRTICVNFPQTIRFLPASNADKIQVTGSPVRQSLINGDAVRGRLFLGFSERKPILLVFGGSLGARVINDCIWESLSRLLVAYQIIHIVGEGNLNREITDEMARRGYVQHEYLHDEFGDVLAASDLVISRAGANTIYELLLTRKPHVLIPLSRGASRGDQLVNAEIFEQAGMSVVLHEKNLTPDSLMSALARLTDERKSYLKALEQFEILDAVD